MRQLYALRSLVLTFSLFVSINYLNAQVTTGGSGNWNSTIVNAPWPSGTAPASGSTVTIAPGHTVTITSSVTQTGVITVQSGGTLICNASLKVSNNSNPGTVVNGTIDITVANGLDHGTGNSPTVSVSGTGRIKFGTNGTTGISSWILSSGSTVEYYGSAQTLSSVIPSNIHYSNLTLSGSGAKKLYYNTTTVEGTLSMQGTATLNLNGHALTYGTTATLEYNTATSRTAGAAEWITPFAATGGVVIANTGIITLDAAKAFNSSVPLTINNGATLNTSSTYNYSLTLGGNFNNDGTLAANASPILIAGTMGTQSIDGFTTNGLVSMTKTSGTATFMGNVTGAGLTISGSGGTLNLGSGLTHTFSGIWTRTSGTLNGGSSTLRLGSSVTNTAGTFTAASGTVEYYASAPQTVAPLTYNNLTLSGTSGITFPAGTTTVTGVLSREGSTSVTLIIGSLSYGGSATLQYKGSIAQTTGLEFPATWAGTGGVKIENALGVTLGAAKNIGTAPFTIGSIVPGSTFKDGGFQLTSTGSLNLNSGTFKLGSATAATTFPTFSGTPVIAAGTTVEYASTFAVQTVSSRTYSNLTISGTNTYNKVAGGDITVNGTLTLSANPSSGALAGIIGSLDMSSFTLNMGAASLNSGAGDVTGIVRRTHTFVNNTPYSFGNPFTTVTFTGASGSSKPAFLSCKISIGTPPVWRTLAVNRFYSFAQEATGTDKVVVNLHYLDSELHGTETDENQLVLWDAHGVSPWSGIKEPHGKSDNDVSENWISLSGLGVDYLAPATTLDNKQWGLSYSNTTKNTWNGTSTVWTNTANWSAGHYPGQTGFTTDDVLIPGGKANYPVLGQNVIMQTLELGSGASLTAGSYDITINGAAGAWINNGGTFDPGTGTVIMSNSSLANIATVSGTTQFHNLTFGATTHISLLAGTYIKISGDVIGDIASIVDLSSSVNTVEYNGTDPQFIVNPQTTGFAGIGYYNLIFSGTGNKTLLSSLNVANDLTLNGGTVDASAATTITILGNVTLNAGTLSAFTSSISLSGNWTNNGATFSPGAGTVVFNNATASQTINGIVASQTFFNLNINKAGQTLFVGGGTNTLNLYSIWILAGTLNPIAESFIYISGDWWRNNGNFIPNGGTVFFSGSSSQEIRGSSSTTFDNLTINNTASEGSRVSLTSVGITVNGVLNLQSANASSTQGALHTGVYTLDMGPSATTIGTGDVTGTVRRTTIVAGTTYTLGNQYSSVTFPGVGTLPSAMSLTITLGTAPVWKTDAILRYFSMAKTGGSDTKATLKIHYLDSELNSNTENLLVPFAHFGTTLIEGKRSDFDVTNDFITISNLSATLPSGTQFTLGNSTTTNFTWTGATNTDWNTTTNWSSAIIPGPTSNVIIPDANNTPNDPSLPSACELLTINLQANGILNAQSGALLTLDGSAGTWNNDGGTFNANGSTVIFANSDATVSGSTNFYNLTINAGTRLATQTGAVIGIAGTMTNNGIWSTAAQGPTTVNYNGGNQTVVIPDVSTNRYSSLILSGTGIKTMPDQELSILGDFSLSGTASAFATQDINLAGNFTIAAGTSFTASSAAFNVGGNWNNSGTFTAGTGTVSFNGSTAQTINGNNSFNNLTINSAGVTASYDQTVNGVLNLQSPNASAFSGSLDMGANILDMGPLATTTGTGDVTGTVRRTTFVPQTSYSFGNQFSTVAFIPGGTYPASLQVRLTIGNSPSWMASAINRVYELVNTGGSNCFANISLHYLDSELNGNIEDRLVKFRWQSPTTITDMGRSNYNTTDNWIENDKVGIGLLPTAFGQVQISMANTTLASYTWNGSLNSDWENTSNWTPVGSPSNLSNVIIPDGGTTPNDPTLRTGGVTLQSISIENGGILNSGDQSLTLSGTSGAWINDGTFNAGSGTVTFTGNGGTISGETDFFNLTINSGADVTNQLGSIIRIGGTMTNNGTWQAALLHNTVEYNGGNQTVINTNAPITGYHTLILSGSGTKTMPATALSVYGDFTVSGTTTANASAAMTIGGNVSVESGATIDLGAFSHTISGNLTNAGGTLTSTLSSLTFNGTGLQTIISSTGLNLNNLTITNTNAPVTSGASTDFTIGGNLTVNSGSVFDLTSNLLTTVTGSLANSGTIRTVSASPTPVPTGKTWGGTLEYYGDAAQTLPAGIYNDLTISGSGGATAAADISVNGSLNLSFGNPSSTKGSLDMSTFTLLLGGSATDTGPGDVTGIVSRTTLNAGVTYTFGNPFMSVYFTTSVPSPLTLSAKISIGTAPTWISGAISRQLEIIQTGLSAPGTKALFTYHYLDAELNGNDEQHLVFWVQHSPANIEYGRSTNNSTDNWVVLSNVDVAFFSSTFDDTKNITLASYSATSTLTWNGSLSDSWTSVENWTPGSGPSTATNIIIPDASTTTFSPTLPEVTEVKSLTIEAGGILNSVALAQLTLNGGAGAFYNSGGTFNSNTSNITFTNAAATVSGVADFFNVTIPLNAKLQNQTGSVMYISGSMTKTGTWDASFFDNTVIYDADGAQVIVPNSYSNLTLRGSGSKTTSGVTVNGILSMEGTATATVAPAYGSAAALLYNTPASRTTGTEWVNPFAATGGIIIDNTGTITLGESKVLNASAPLTINSGAVLAVGAPFELAVNGSIINNAGPTGLVIQSSAGGDGKLINNSPDVDATVELFLTGGSSNFHFIVPPVSTMAIGTTKQNVKDNLGITNFNNDLMSYSGSAAGSNQNNGWQYYDGYTGTSFTYAPFSSLVSSKGYNIYLTADDKISFKGTLNNSPHTFSLDRTSTSLGWFLVGNPYPCNYDLTGVTSLTTPDNGLDKTIYFYHAGSYSYYNMTIGAGTGGLTNIIPPMQGFFVRVNPSTGPMSFPASSKTSTAAAPRSKKANLGEASPVEKIKLTLSNSTVSDETIVCLIDNATTGFDGDYDGYKLFGANPSVPDIYTVLGSIKYAINSVPGTGSGQERIPVVVVIKTPGTYKIDIPEFENLDGIRVVLRHGVIETILSKNASYSFSSAAGTFTDFEILIGDSPTAVEKTTSENLTTWYSNNFMYFKCPADIVTGNATLTIYDVLGKPVYNNIQLYLTPGQTMQLPVNLPKGVYLTRITLNKQIFVSKFVVL